MLRLCVHIFFVFLDVSFGQGYAKSTFASKGNQKKNEKKEKEEGKKEERVETEETEETEKNQKILRKKFI